MDCIASLQKHLKEYTHCRQSITLAAGDATINKDFIDARREFHWPCRISRCSRCDGSCQFVALGTAVPTIVKLSVRRSSIRERYENNLSSCNAMRCLYVRMILERNLWFEKYSALIEGLLRDITSLPASLEDAMQVFVSWHSDDEFIE